MRERYKQKTSPSWPNPDRCIPPTTPSGGNVCHRNALLIGIMPLLSYLDTKHCIEIIDDDVPVFHVTAGIFYTFRWIWWWALGGRWYWRYKCFQLMIVQEFLANIVDLRYCQLHKLERLIFWKLKREQDKGVNRIRIFLFKSNGK